MSIKIKIKVHVLCKWNLYEFGSTKIFPHYDSAYKEMAKQYNESLNANSSHIEDDTDIYSYGAKIVTIEGSEEWQIFVCGLEIANHADLLSTFGVTFGIQDCS